MKTLVVTEVDGVLGCSPLATAMAKRALVQPDWALAVLTSMGQDRASETLQFLASKIKISQAPKSSPTYWCGGPSPWQTGQNKVRAFEGLLRQHYTVERVLCFDTNLADLEHYAEVLRGRQQPTSWTLWLVAGKDARPIFSTATYATPSETT